MPASPVVKMRARANERPKRLTEAEKAERREKREKSKMAVPMWIVIALFVILVGSSIVQVYFNVVSTPSLTD